MIICYLYPFNAFLFILCPFSNFISALLLSYESLYLIASISLAWGFILIKELCRMRFFVLMKPSLSAFLWWSLRIPFLDLDSKDFSLFYFLKVFIIIFSHFNSFSFPYEFWNKLLYIDRKSCLDFDRNWIEPVYWFGENWHLNWTESSVPQMWYIYPLI